MNLGSSPQRLTLFPPAQIMLRLAREKDEAMNCLRTSIRVALPSLLFIVAGCGSSGPTCSSDRVVALVKQIGAEQLGKTTLRFTFDMPHSQYAVNAIRTDSSTDRKCECQATFRVVFALPPQVQEMKEKNPEEFAKWSSVATNHLDNGGVSVPITYSAQLTDDNKDVYVQASGF